MTETAPIVHAGRLRLELGCDLAESRRAALATREFLAREGCHEDDLLDCELALVEACNNAIKYADAEGCLKAIVVDVECRPAEIELNVLDHTAGFDLPEDIHLPEPESESGRGLFIMKAVMRELRYRRAPDGNVLTMIRQRTAS